jgi:hypothetical protein
LLSIFQRDVGRRSEQQYRSSDQTDRDEVPRPPDDVAGLVREWSWQEM